MPREYLNPPGLFHHPNYTRVLTVEKPSNLLQLPETTNTYLQNRRFSAPN